MLLSKYGPNWTTLHKTTADIHDQHAYGHAYYISIFDIND